MSLRDKKNKSATHHTTALQVEGTAEQNGFTAKIRWLILVGGVRISVLCSKQRIQSLYFYHCKYTHFFESVQLLCENQKISCQNTFWQGLPKVMLEKGLGASYDNLNGNENQRGSSLEAPSPVSRPNEYHGRMSVEECQSDGRRRSPALGLPSHSSASSASHPDADYLFPFARLCVLQSIWQFSIEVSPPLLQAVTWSASISDSFQMRVLLVPPSSTQCGQLLTPFSLASLVWRA